MTVERARRIVQKRQKDLWNEKRDMVEEVIKYNEVTGILWVLIGKKKVCTNATFPSMSLDGREITIWMDKKSNFRKLPKLPTNLDGYRICVRVDHSTLEDLSYY